MQSSMEQVYELSPMQQAMLFHTLYAPGSGVYVLQMSLRLTGPLQAEAFETSWRHLLERHAILRTGFYWEDLDKPLQVVHREVPLPLERLSLRGLPAEEQQHRLAALLAVDRERGFDLTEPPLLRLTLVELAEGTHQLLWSLHHLLVDGWSQGQLLRELFACYAAFAAGGAPRLPAAGSFRDYISWLQSQDLAAAEAFWRRTLQGFTTPTLLAGGEARADTRGFLTARRRDRPLPAALSASLREAGRRHRLTLNTLVQGAWALVLAQATGRDEVVFGTTVAGRPAGLPGVETTLGLFINTQPVRVAVRPDADLWRWLGGLQELQVEMRRFEHAPLVDVQRWSELPAGTPLFDHLLVFENLALPGELSRPVAGLEVTEEASHELTNFPLNVIVLPGTELLLTLRWDAGRLGTAEVVRLLERLTGLLAAFAAFAAEPARPVSRLPLLLEGERRQVLAEWNDTAAPYAGPCLHELFRAQAARTPEATAVVDGTLRLTYAELAGRATALSHHLRRLGAGPEERVAVCLERSADLVATLLGVLGSGAAYVPLDPAYPTERRALMLEDSGAAVLVTRGGFAVDLPAADLPRLDLDRGLPEGPPDSEGVVPWPGHLAYVIYTSGSTGRPKGVAIEHRSAVGLMGWARQTFSAEELGGMLAATSVCFDLSVFEIFAPLSWGGTVFLAENALELPRLAAAAEVRLLNTVPSAAAELVRSGELPAGVGTVCLAGEALPASLAARLYATGTVTRVLNLYGPTEDTTYSTGSRVPVGTTQAPAIGRPLPGTRAFVVDRHGLPVPPGVAGELWLAGAGLARGYLGRPELTAERFLPDPFVAPGEGSNRVYRTGDLVRWRLDGSLEFLGRLDHQIKLHGFRIELGEIEDALRHHPEVREAVVLARGDRLVAWVVAPEPLASLGGWLRAKLPSYMVPAAFVRLDGLPLTPNGKLDRRALPEPDRPAGAAGGEPSDPVEELLAGIWSEVLGVERVGVGDDFFALGGHSLLATQVVSRIRSTLGCDVALRQLFETPTVAALAAVLRERGTGAPALPLRAVPRDGELPLSFAQQRLWLIDRLQSGVSTYHVPLALRLTGEISPPVLERLFAAIVHRHEVLRTTFAAGPDGPLQVIAAAQAVPLPLLDLAPLPAARREAEARRLAGAAALRPFDLERGPLLRLLLVRLGAADHLLLLTFHHIVTDGWSLGVLLREIAALLPAIARGEPSPLPPLPVQYADFAAWQRRWLQGEVLEAQIGFWKRQLAGAPALLELPLDRPRPPIPSRRGRAQPFTLAPALSADLAGRARENGATPFMVLLAAWAVLLGRHAGQDDVLVGTPIAGRTRREIEGLIGFFVNTLVLRSDLTGDPPFADLLARVRQTALDAFAHQDLPFERLVEEVVTGRSLEVTPLFQTLFVFQNAPVEPVVLPGLALAPFPFQRGVTHFDLTLTVWRGPAGFTGALEHATELFDDSTARRLLDRFTGLLAAAMADPARPLRSLPLLLPAELHQVQVELNDTAHPFLDACLQELVEATARRVPDAVAVVADGDGGTACLSYGTLDRRANALAWRLGALGVGPEVPVGLCAERSLDLIVGLLAILKAGGAWVPLDPEHPPDHLARLLEDSGLRLVLGPPHLAAVLPREAVHSLPPGSTEERSDRPTGAVSPRNLACILYTSGSTGRPKGVLLPHAGLVNRILWAQRAYPVTADDRILQKASFNFDFAVWEIFAALFAGARLVLARPGEQRDPAALVRTIGGHEITLVHFIPSLMQLFVAEAGLEDLAAVRLVFAGGEALPAELATRLLQRLRAALRNQYGPTEACIDATSGIFRPDGGARGVVPLGQAVDNTTVHVLDRDLRPAPLGVPGEIWIGGVAPARGYRRRPDLTAERFLPDPFGAWSGGRLYRTGDLARRRPDGGLEFLGRIDQQVKIRGFRIEPGEIEAVLTGHPEVREAVALARPSVAGGLQLVAWVTLSPGAAAGAADLRLWLRERLPEHLVPAAVAVLDAFPVTATGKIDRRALPEPEIQAAAETRLSPSDPLEELLAGLWAEILGLDRVGANDDFFALGGHSLLATRLVSRLRAVLGVELPLRTLFEAPTVAGLARAVREAGTARAAAAPLVPAPRSGPLPLSFAQQRLWLLHRMDPDSPTYNVPFAVRLTGAVDPRLLQRVFAEIVRRHETLRTTFAEHEGDPRQVIAAGREPDLPLLDLTALPPDLRDRQARHQTSEEARRPFDLTRGPLLRLALLRLAPREHLLLLSLHHIVADGWSVDVLLREVSLLAEAWSRGLPSPLPELPVQYADFAVWQRGRLHGETLEAQLGFWTRQLAGAATVLDLPLDRPRPSSPSGRGAVRWLPPAPDLAASLPRLARSCEATPFMVLLAAWAAFLGRHTGQEDLLIGSPIAGRNLPEIEGLIGCFVNTLALRADLSGSPTFGELVVRLRQTSLQAFSHQDLPFERVVEELAGDRSPGVSALVQVSFSLQNHARRELALPGAQLAPVDSETGAVKFDLSLAWRDGPAGLSGALEHSTDLFDAGTVERLAGRLMVFLTAALAAPETRLPDLPVLLEGERHQLLVEGNDVSAPAPDLPVHALLAARSAAVPDAIAAVLGEAAVSHGEVLRRAADLARRLRDLGASPDGRVAFLLDAGPEVLIAMTGILAAGCGFIPLDPRLPDDRLSWMLRDAGCSLVVTQGLHRERAERFAPTVPCLGASRPAADATARHGCVDPQALAYAVYTSGSTGTPKGVLISHENLAPMLRWGCAFLGLGPTTRALQSLSSSFDFGIFEHLTTLLAGGTLVFPGAAAGDPAGCARMIREREIDTLHCTPAFARELAGTGVPFDSLALLHLGGEALAWDTVERLRRAAPRARLYNGYGPTEATVNSSIYRIPEAPGATPVVPIGRRSAANALSVVDREGNPVPLGVPGELQVGGVGVARGYLGHPGLTAERFVPGPLGTRLYRTGDRVRFLPGGDLEFLGRLDRQVKIRGFRIEPGEIEAALREHPAVREAAVDVRPGPTGAPLLVAWVVGGEPATLQEYLAGRLPPPLVPAVLQTLPALPLTPGGKLDRKALPTPQVQTGATPAHDPLEELLAGIWCEVLHLERVGVDDSFFVLGGHSLLAAQVVSRVRTVLGVELPLRALFETPTVAQLARTLRRSGSAGAALLPATAARLGAAPLSFAQQRLWLIDRLEPGSPAYNIPFAVRMTGAVALPVFRRIFAEIVRRHEVLRTTFVEKDGLPLQVIASEHHPELPVIDLTSLPGPRREGRARRLTREEARRPFDLRRGPLLRLALLRLAEEEHVLLLTLHHIVADGWSLGVLLREIAALHEAFSNGLPSPLPELPLQVADFALWQRSRLQGEALEEQLGFWRRLLAGAPPVLELPLDHPRPASPSGRGAARPGALSPDLSASIVRLARARRATPFMVLLAAWADLLGRQAGQEDVVIGCPIAGRNRREIEGLIGFFVNTLALRIDRSGLPSFEALLHRVRQVVLDAFAHQDVPFERVVEEVVTERNLAVAPLFQVTFLLQNLEQRELAVPGLVFAPVELETGVAKFDLSLVLREGPDGFLGVLEHSTDLLEGSTVEGLWSRLAALLAAGIENPEAPLADLPLLTAPERHQLLVEWNTGGAVGAGGRALHELFAAQAARTPDAVALVHPAEQLTYAQLAGRAGGIAHHLRGRGVGPEVCVAVCLERTTDLVAALLGVLAAGGAYVPIDPAYPEERRALMLEDSGASVQIGGESLAGLAPAPLPQVEVRPGNLAYLIYTSGSTGRPKAVAVEHRSAAALVAWAVETFDRDELSGVLAATSVCFDLSVFEIFAPLACGGTVILADNALALPTLPGKDRVRLLNTVPSAAGELVRSQGLPASVRTVCLAGEPLPAALAGRLHATGTVERVWNLYGPSEDTTYSTAALLPREAGRPPAIGRPLPGTRAYVVDRHGFLVPPGVAGELWLAGDGLARGYLNRPELTAGRFTPDPFGDASDASSPGTRVYRTGDLVRRRPNGDLEFLGRLDRQVKIRGFRIEPGEIEAALRAHPAVREAAVEVRPGPTGDPRLVAWVAGGDPADLPAFLAGRLPAHLVPAAFVLLPTLPLTPNGKLDRRALPAPESAESHGRPRVAPRTRTEEEVAAIWQEILGLREIGVDESFFALGGHSLLATQVLAAIRSRFEVEIPLRDLFRQPTVAGLAAWIEGRVSPPPPEDEAALDALLAELDLLSEEEASARLSRYQTLERDAPGPSPAVGRGTEE